MSEKTIALLGQPNSGKSTLFNGLTGSRQHVGNWPGKTVERKDGSFVHKDTTYKIIDLPGTYSLSANSDEEVVTRNYIASGQADVVCILADASQLNRSLFMLADYTGIRVPVVLLLNMMDVAKSQGKQIDTNGIAKSLGIPVVPLVAADKKQYGTFFRMLESIDKNASTLDEKRLAQIYQNTIGAAFDEIKALLPADGIGIYSSTWLTAKLIEQDKLARSLVKEIVDAGTYTAIEKKLSDVKDGNLLTGDCKFQWIDKLVNENVTSKKNKLLRSRFDKAATSKRWGKPIAIGMIVLGLICSMVIGFPLMGLFSGLISAISVPLANWLLDIGAAPFLVSLLCNAILTAVSFALQMASYVFGISLVFGLMEDVGYMARISYVFDDTMTKLGLQGKAIMPFLVSFGCNIGGITGTKILPQWRVSHHHRRENPSVLHCGGCAGTLLDRNGRSIYEYFRRKEVPDMNEKITAHPQKEEREKVLKEIRQLENRKKILENKQRNEERRVRTRRLIERGAVLEGIFPLAPDLSGAEVKTFLIALSHLPGAAELTANLPKSGDTP